MWMRNGKIAAGVIQLAVLLTSSPAQMVSLSRIEQADLNQSKLEVTLTLDRQEYFPGEIVELSLSVKNSTSEALEIPAPFMNQTGTIGLLEKGNRMAKTYGQPYGPIGPGAYSIDLGDFGFIPTLVIKPGEVLMKKLRSYDTDLAESSTVLVGGAAPNWTGDFRLTYWGAQADFRVVMPVFEGMIKAAWPEWDERQSGFPEHKTERVQQNVYVVLLAAGGKHFICLDRAPFSGKVDQPPTDSAGKLIDYGFHLNRYSRLADSDTTIVSLKGEADASGNMLLTWGSAGERRLFVDRNHLILSPPKRAR